MMKNNRVQRAINNTLSSLYITERDAALLLDAAKGGKKVKKKLSVVMVMVIVLIIGLTTALALTFGWADAVFFLKKERNQGTFQGWTAKEQVSLIDSLVQDGFIPETQQVKKLRDTTDDKARSALAREIMMDWLSRPQEHIAFRTIMEKIWGDFRSWTPEQKVWFTSINTEAGIQTEDMEKYVLPGKNDIPAETAVRLAKMYLGIWLDITLEAMEEYQAYNEFVIFPRAKKQEGKTVYTTEGEPPVWLIQFERNADDDYPNSLLLEIDPKNGQPVLESVITLLRQITYGSRTWPEAAMLSEEALKAQDFKPMMSWSHQARHQWTQEIRPLILALQKADKTDSVSLAYSHYQYGLPNEKSIPEKEALVKAMEAARALNSENAKTLDRYDNVFTYYDVSNTATPLWRVHISATGRLADDITRQRPVKLLNYRIELNAYTGEVVTVETYEQGSITGYEAIVMQL